MRKLQAETTEYDAVWPASSIWISLGDEASRVKHISSTAIMPVVFGIRESLAEELGFTSKEVSIRDIMDAISAGKLKFCMTSATQSNSGASAYIGFLTALAGNPQAITEENLADKNLRDNIKKLLSGVDRSSGSSEWLKTLFLEGDFDAMVNYESLIITTNQELERRGEETLHVIYPYDGLSVSDSPLGYIDQGDEKKEKIFLDFQEYLASDEAKNEMQKLGRRTDYQGVADEYQTIFRTEWGVDTKRVLQPINMPKSEVLLNALNLYQTDFRKPSLTVYCLDCSGSMSGGGIQSLRSAMNLILDQEEAKNVFLQAGRDEVNIVIPFNDRVLGVQKAEDGSSGSLDVLNEYVQGMRAGGGTDMYVAIEQGLDELGSYDLSVYNPAIIVMSDGESIDSYDRFESRYTESGLKVPIFSIMFGSADEGQLKQLAELSGARVFDGREDLVGAFRSVKGYN
jgi:Ca-activated chloride channel family protein